MMKVHGVLKDELIPQYGNKLCVQFVHADTLLIYTFLVFPLWFSYSFTLKQLLNIEVNYIYDSLILTLKLIKNVGVDLNCQIASRL